MLKQFFAIGWALTAGVGAASVVAANIFFVLAIGPAYFPGDPPAADLIVEQEFIAVLYAAIGTVVIFVASRRSLESRSLRVVSRLGGVFVLLAAVASAPTLAEVAKRHFGEWAQLRQILNTTASDLRLEAGPTETACAA